MQDMADEMSEPPVISYFLCDSWYTDGDIMDAFNKKATYHWSSDNEPRVVPPCVA